jgi:outer membrane protein assembly factor BamA
MRRALLISMKNIKWLFILLVLIRPLGLFAEDQKSEANVNERYRVESIAYTGVNENKISKPLREEAQKLVGAKYNEKISKDLAGKMASELKTYTVRVKVKRGDAPDHVKVIFQAESTRWHQFQVSLNSASYHSKQGFNGALDIPIRIHNNVFAFGIVSDADELLERNAGIRLRYENRKVGTDLLHLQMNLDSYHQSFNYATRSALTQRPDVPDVYRARQNFATSLALYPAGDLMISAGVSFQRLQFQSPSLHTEKAYSGTADIEYRRKIKSASGSTQNFTAHYSLRTATRILDSDFVYTRHFATIDYSVDKNKHHFVTHFIGGFIGGSAPLFERFSFGNSYTLRGWNKFDVAPLGGNRAAHGSLEYGYQGFRLFYDLGSVWDAGREAKLHHGLGFGFAPKNGFYASLAFPVRQKDISPIFMIGFRGGQK